jgi:glycosyltransferase involved in cell wall biosynthesis
MIKLFIVSPTFFPTVAGAQLRFLRYLPGFRTAGVDVTVFTGTQLARDYAMAADLDTSGVRLGGMFPPEQKNGARVLRTRLPGTSRGLRVAILYTRLVLFCRDKRERPDVIHFVSDFKPIALPWLLMLRLLGVRLVHSVTLLPKSKLPKRPDLYLRKRYRRAMLSHLYNALDAMIVASRPLEDYLKGVGVRIPIHVVPNGVDTSRFRPAASVEEKREIRARFGLPERGLLVLSVGAVSDRKGSHLLLGAWADVSARHATDHLVFAGPSDAMEGERGGFSEKMQRLLGEQPRADSVHFLGNVVEVETLYRAADLVVLASSREGMPNSVLEGMASGVAVMMTPFAGLGEDFGAPGHQFWLVDRNRESLAEELDAALSDGGREAIAAAGCAWINTHMNWDQAVSGYVGVYDRLARAPVSEVE